MIYRRGFLSRNSLLGDGRSGRSGLSGHRGQAKASTTSTSSIQPRIPTYPEIAANAILVLINVASYLLDRQLKTQSVRFLEEGGFTEKLYQSRKSRHYPA